MCRESAGVAIAQVVAAHIGNLKCVLHEIDLHAASGLDNEIDLDAGLSGSNGSRDRRAGEKGLTEIFCVDAIHRGEVSHVREKHTGAHES